MKTKFVKLRDLGAGIGHVDTIPRSRYVGYHNCQESQLIEETCVEIREDRNGNQYVTKGTHYRCSICGATFKKEVE